MRRLGPSAALTSLVLSFAGCGETVHFLGTLPVDGNHGALCSEDSTGGADSGISANAAICTAAAGGSSSGRSGGATAAGGSTGTGGSSDAGTGGAISCVPKRALATRRGLNLLLLVDASPSVALQPVWTNLTAAISRFVESPDNTGLGLGIEYYGTSCSAADYATPTVAIADLPGNTATIEASYPFPINGKPIVPALHGAAGYLRTVIAADPDRDAELVLVTDGILDPVCSGTAVTAAAEAAQALGAMPSLKTYVVALGVGPTLINPGGILPDLAPLDTIAKAGGTDRAERVEVNLTTNDQLTTALITVTARARPCAFAIPAKFAADRVSLEWRPTPDKPVVAWPRIDSEAACGSRAAVYPSDSPGYLELCSAACSALQVTPLGLVTAVEACATP